MAIIINVGCISSVSTSFRRKNEKIIKDESSNRLLLETKRLLCETLTNAHSFNINIDSFNIIIFLAKWVDFNRFSLQEIAQKNRNFILSINVLFTRYHTLNMGNANNLPMNYFLIFPRKFAQWQQYQLHTSSQQLKLRIEKLFIDSLIGKKKQLENSFQYTACKGNTDSIVV